MRDQLENRKLPDSPSAGADDREAAEASSPEREAGKPKSRKASIFGFLVIAAAIVAVIALFFPILRIYGSSMSPNLNEGEVVLSVKSSHVKQGDVVAVNFGNKLLVKRCVAVAGQQINIDAEGTVSVDGQPLEEPYLAEKALGDCTTQLPYQIPEGQYFVMGDNRSKSQDSRNANVGCVAGEQILGKVLLCIWPLSSFGIV